VAVSVAINVALSLSLRGRGHGGPERALQKLNLHFWDSPLLAGWGSGSGRLFVAQKLLINTSMEISLVALPQSG
jgi:hypothetical protein